MTNVDLVLEGFILGEAIIVITYSFWLNVLFEWWRSAR